MAKRARKQVKSERAEYVDATPERIAMEESEFIDPSRIDSNLPIGLTRKFRASHLDRLYRRDDDKSPLTWTQWHAGDWYRNVHHRARFGLSVVSSYGERTTGGEISYGLPRTEAQLRARRLWQEARKQWPEHMTGFMDRLLIHDSFPRFSGRSAYRNLREVAKALDRLSDWLISGKDRT